MATTEQQKAIVEQREAEYKRNDEFQKAIRRGLSADILFVLKTEAAILAPEVRGKIADQVASKVFNRLQDMFNIGDDE